jgi:hypothetical protein
MSRLKIKMMLQEFSRLRLPALAIVLAMVGARSFAEVGICGTHSIDDLVSDEISGLHNVFMFDGTFLERPIPDMAGVMDLTRVGDQIILTMQLEEGSAEFTLSRVDPDDALDFRGAGFEPTLDEIANVSGCGGSGDFPQYFGPGVWSHHAPNSTIRLFIWLGTDGDGIETGKPEFWAVGVLRGPRMNGKIMFTD